MCSFVIFPMLNLRITPHDPRFNNCYICLLIKSRSPLLLFRVQKVAWPCRHGAQQQARRRQPSSQVEDVGMNARGGRLVNSPGHVVHKTLRNKSDEDEKIGPNSHSCCRHMRGEEKTIDIACGMCGSLWNVQYVP